MVVNKARGFATLAAIALLVLTLALVAVSLLLSQQTLVNSHRAEAQLDKQDQTWKIMDLILNDLSHWNADEQTFDGWWAAHTAGYGSEVVLRSLSGLINLNSLSPFLLQKSSLVGTLNGKTVDDFVSWRTSKGPFPSVDGYKSYFTAASLQFDYCTVSFFNVNTADEIMLERLVALRTGSDSAAANLRSQVRDRRSRRQIFTPADWQTVSAGFSQDVGPLDSTDPELDANEAPVDVLTAILGDPDFKITDAATKVQTLIAQRAAAPLTSAAMALILGVAATSPIMQYLGTRTHWIECSLPFGTSRAQFVIALTYSTDAPPQVTPRILNINWGTS